MSRENAKCALDKIINKARAHFYKPIQIAETLYHARISVDQIDLLNIEEYRNKSKKWRNDISDILVGRSSSSSAKYQDDVFNDNAMPPILLSELGMENTRTNGAVEAYIYSRIERKRSQFADALLYCTSASKEVFDVNEFISSFRREQGLKRSIDKVYEIVVYSLFSTLVSALELKIDITIDKGKADLLAEFADFANMIMCLDTKTTTNTQNANVFRVGVTNAADRGLDMYSNWGDRKSTRLNSSH